MVLFKHQQEALDRFKDKTEIALFFEMGCGKTLTSLAIICEKFKRGEIDSALVIAPNDVHKQWYDDLTEESTLTQYLEQAHIEVVVQCVGGRGGKKTLSDFDGISKTHKLQIACVNVDTFSQPHKWEAIVDWANSHTSAIILDEATSIKNPHSKRAQRLLYEFNDVVKRGKVVQRSVKKHPVRIALTGTPVTNGPLDLWSIMEFVEPNFFNRNYFSFVNHYGMFTKLNLDSRTVTVPLTENTWRGIKKSLSYGDAYARFGCSEDTYLVVKSQQKYSGPYKHADELREQLNKVAMFARLIDCVDMPSRNYITKKVPLSVAQETAYKSMKQEMLVQYEDHLMTAKNKLVVSLRLQQISSGFIVAREVEQPDIFWEQPSLDESYDVKSDEVVWLGDINPKLEQLLRDVDELAKPVLVFTRFSAEAAKIYDLLKDKYSVCLQTGWKTVGSIERFKNGEYDVMVANIAKLAKGFNLQNAHSTIYYSNTFSMELRQQSEFRTFRMGQKFPCTYISYVASDIDSTVLKALQDKKGLLEYMRNRRIEELV